MRRMGTALVLIAALGMTATAAAAPKDTTVRTIQDTDGDNLLEFAPGEDHCVFTLSLTPSDADCERGPADRQEAELDPQLPPAVRLPDGRRGVPGACRGRRHDPARRRPEPVLGRLPSQESLGTQITEAMVRQARNTTSPVTGAQLELTMLTGDNADSQQYNETRWFIDMLDGTTGNGNPDPEMSRGPRDRKIVPDSGIEALASTCGPGYTDNGSLYDGVRDDGGPGQDAGYYEPDGEGDGDGYTPDRARNLAETGSPRAT